MAKPATMINEVVELLIEGKTTKEITDETGCSISTVSVARKRVDARKEEINGKAEVDEKETDEAIDSFIQKIKIKPDNELLTDKEEKVEDIEYQCPGCKHIWFAPPTERQDTCPNCDMEFN